MNQFLENILGSAPNAVYAVVLLLIALIVALIAKAIVMKALKLFKADRLTDKLGIKDEVSGSSIAFVGKLVFAVVFLLFLPGALDKLGMQNVSAPISGLTSQFLDYIPNILAAAIIIVFGVFLAKLLASIVSVLLKKTKIDNLQRKYAAKSDAAENVEPQTTLSDVIGKLVHAVIVILALVAALQVLGIEAISKPAMDVVNQVIGILPGVFAAIVLVAVGVFLANLVCKLLESVLASVGLDKLTDKMMPNRATPLKGSKILSIAAKVIILVIFVVEAVSVLNLPVLTSIGDTVLSYLPIAISALIVIGAAIFLGAWAEKLILKSKPDATLCAKLTKAGILILAVFMALSQLGIAKTIVNSAFVILLAAAAVAAALAFGLGGRGFAARLLDKVDSKESEKCEKTPKPEETQSADDTPKAED